MAATPVRGASPRDSLSFAPARDVRLSPPSIYSVHDEVELPLTRQTRSASIDLGPLPEPKTGWRGVWAIVKGLLRCGHRRD